MINTRAKTANANQILASSSIVRSTAADLTSPPLPGWLSRVRPVVNGVVRAVTGAVSALAYVGNPGYFELERKVSVQTKVGPGISRLSDSFWPLSEW